MYSDQEIFLAHKYATAFLRVWHHPFDKKMAQRLWVAALFFQRYGVMLWHQSDGVLQHVVEGLGFQQEHFSALLELLKRQHRLSHFPQVMVIFAKLYAKKTGVAAVQVGYSHTVSEEREALLRNLILGLFSEEIMYISWINRALIAGVTVQGAGCFWECSVRRRLSSYAHGLIGSN